MSGAFAAQSHGTPRPGDVLAFGAGAVGAYGVLRLTTRCGEIHPDGGLGPRGLLRAGAIHVASLALGAAVALYAGRLAGEWGWFLTPLAGTSLYFAGIGVAETLRAASSED